MTDRRLDDLERVARAILETPGETAPELRRAIASGGPVPAELAGFLADVDRHAYRTTDAQVDALRAAGYSEDAIFEVVLAAALGAATVRLEAGLRAIEGTA